MKDIIQKLSNSVCKHFGDDSLKKLYAVSLLSMGIENVEEPLHIHVYGDPESGKTDLQTRYMEIIPLTNKDNASDFSPKVLMYSNLCEGTIISINDKILNDSVAAILNQICDSTSWRKGRTCATIVGKDRVNLTFPPRCLFWMNSNKDIIEYGIREVDPYAVKGRFMSFKKEYTYEQKEEIFTKRNFAQDMPKEEVEALKVKLTDMFKTPVKVSCSEEMRKIIWNKSREMGIDLIRSIGRNLTICQVFAYIDGRLEVKIEDIENTFKLLNEIKISIPDTQKNSILIENQLMPESEFKTYTPDKKVCYSIYEIQKRTKLSKEEIEETLKQMKTKGNVGSEVIKKGTLKTLIECFFLVNK
jgi:hypothetical protein